MKIERREFTTDDNRPGCLEELTFGRLLVLVDVMDEGAAEWWRLLRAVVVASLWYERGALCATARNTDVHVVW